MGEGGADSASTVGGEVGVGVAGRGTAGRLFRGEAMDARVLLLPALTRAGMMEGADSGSSSSCHAA